MNFDELYVISETAILREARVSKTFGKRVRDELKSQGLINPKQTPSGRTEYITPEAEILFNALHGRIDDAAA